MKVKRTEGGAIAAAIASLLLVSTAAPSVARAQWSGPYAYVAETISMGRLDGSMSPVDAYYWALSQGVWVEGHESPWDEAFTLYFMDPSTGGVLFTMTELPQLTSAASPELRQCQYNGVPFVFDRSGKLLGLRLTGTPIPVYTQPGSVTNAIGVVAAGVDKWNSKIPGAFAAPVPFPGEVSRTTPFVYVRCQSANDPPRPGKGAYGGIQSFPEGGDFGLVVLQDGCGVTTNRIGHELGHVLGVGHQNRKNFDESSIMWPIERPAGTLQIVTDPLATTLQQIHQPGFTGTASQNCRPMDDNVECDGGDWCCLHPEDCVDPCNGDPCCGDPCCGDPCCGDPCCGDPWCGDPCQGDPCCGDPCCGDVCCGDPVCQCYWYGNGSTIWVNEGCYWCSDFCAYCQSNYDAICDTGECGCYS